MVSWILAASSHSLCIVSDYFLSFRERQNWRCANCAVWGTAVWAVRDGPYGPRVRCSIITVYQDIYLTSLQTLCHNCGFLYERDKVTPEWSKDLHRHDIPIGRIA